MSPDARAQSTSVDDLAKQLRTVVLTIASVVVEAMDMVDHARQKHSELSTALPADDALEFGEVTASPQATGATSTSYQGDPHVLRPLPAATTANGDDDGDDEGSDGEGP